MSKIFSSVKPVQQLQRRWIRFALFAFACMAASGASAQFGEISNIDVSPPTLTPQSPVEITVSGRQGDACHQIDHQSSVEGNTIQIDAELSVDSEAVCPAVVVPFVFTEEVGGLNAGTYVIEVDIRDAEDGTLIDSATRSIVVLGDLEPVMTLSPASGYYAESQEFDFVVILSHAGLSVIGGSAVLLEAGQPIDEGAEFSEALTNCVESSDFEPQGQVFRCSGISGEDLGAGTHIVNVSLTLSDETVVSDSVVWTIIDDQGDG